MKMKERIKMELVEAPLDKIKISEDNVRKSEPAKGLEDLKNSIRQIGLQHPPVAFRKGDQYEVVIGQRRLTALKELGWETAPLLVRDSVNPIEAKIVSLSENIQRVRLSGRDMSDVCSYLKDKLGKVDAVAKMLGVKPLTVKKYLGYRIVPESIKKFVDQKKITVPVATRIATIIPNEEKAVEMTKKVARMTKPERERTFDIMREEPEAPVEHIIKRAEKAKVRRKIVIHLSEDVVGGIKKASRTLGLDLESTIETAVIDWLSEQDYL